MKMDGTKIVYEVGDWVTVLGKSYCGSCYKKGDVEQIIECIDAGFVLSNARNVNRFINYSGIRLSSQEEINKATEEIKPREWWITEHRDDPVGVVNRLSICEEKPSGCPVTNCEIIKVKEVLE